MRQSNIIFTMTATPREGGERIFRNSIGRIAADGAGGATFGTVELADSAAVLRGEIVADPRLVTNRSLAEYLEDTLASKEDIHLDLDVRIQARSLPLSGRRAAAMAA
ncbi:hypothetical protein ACFQ36_12865 [Arthrobacter sp. GCM10027362]|uniref:hypothetical protein n=1 Tax=Arthrobacter sp. GCM10027362 TaxID=3273379 RepID=UPI00362CA8E8